MTQNFYQCSTHLPGIKDEKSGIKPDSYPPCCIIFRVRYRLTPILLAGILVLLISLAMLAWGIWPVGRSTRQAALRLPGGGVYTLELTWPAWMRARDAGVVRLVLMAEQGNEPGDDLASALGAANRLAESRLEAAGLKSVPLGEIMEPLLPGKQAIFYWSVLPEQRGEIEAVVWVSLRTQAAESGEAGSQAILQSQLLTAQKIPIRTIDLFGLDGRAARLSGGVGVIIGVVLCLEGFLSLQKRFRNEESSHYA